MVVRLGRRAYPAGLIEVVFGKVVSIGPTPSWVSAEVVRKSF